MSRKRVISDLKASSERVGRLYPILLDRHGNVIDGRHRLAADENWPKMRLESVETEEQRLIARLISNTCRRHVSAEEKTEMLGRLGEIYSKEGVEPGKIAHRISDETGMTCRWVTKYLPDKFKDPLQSKRASSAERRSAGILDKLLSPPQRDGALTIKKFANTDFVSLMLEGHFYEEFERDSLELGVSTEISALKALEDYHEKMKRAIALKNKASGEGENQRIKKYS